MKLINKIIKFNLKNKLKFFIRNLNFCGSKTKWREKIQI